MRTLFLVLAIMFLFHVARSYWNARNGGSTWDTLATAVKDSTTIAWAWFVGIVGAGANILLYLADWLEVPGVADAIRAILTPEYTAYALLAMAVITEWARRRRLG